MNTSSTTNSQDYKRQQIRAYTKAGFTLFPCCNIKEIKAPRFEGWRNTPYDPLLDAEDLPDVYGVLLQDDDIVIDVDPRRYVNDVDQFQALAEKLSLGKFDTFIVKTPGGGVHIYLKKDPNYPIRRRLDHLGFGAIELKSAGQYVVAAGSVVNGIPYQVIRHIPAYRTDCPDSLLKFAHVDNTGKTKEPGVESDGRATQERFIQFCLTCDPAIKGQGGDAQTYKVAAEGREYGLSEEKCYEIMRDYFGPRCTPNDPEYVAAFIRRKVNNVYKYAQNKSGRLNPEADFENAVDMKDPDTVANIYNDKMRWDYTMIGKTELKKYDPTMRNIFNFMTKMPTTKSPNPLYQLIKYNEFSHQVEFCKLAPWHILPKKLWDDNDTLALKLWIAQNRQFNAATSLYDEAVQNVAMMHTYHPIRDYLNSLKWDGVARLDTWLTDYAGAADDDYTQCVSKVCLIAAVARVFQPGCQYDTMVVWEGDQGTFKTTAVRVLGGGYSADVLIDTHSRDTIDAMQGYWFLEASEMDFTKKAEVTAIRRFLTITEDRVRLAYARRSVTLPRQSTFIGTVNPNEHGYLNDSEGNRRFLPVAIRKFKIEELKHDRDQLFAEAVVRYHAGEKWHVPEHLESAAKREQQKRMQTDIWEQTILRWLTGAEEFGLPDPLTTESIAIGALNLSPTQMGLRESSRIGNCMRALGYESVKQWDGKRKKQSRKWVLRHDEMLGDL